ncbi:putative disease resistance protein At5g05400 [Vitis riparia]|uniref:putative disease resistance protein At5g05400 n=1 Tax=Vitis riparia TaxID=96939 RepID=UPI00155AE0B5|nr:putative disease resistance protein At5g05400 [Vitis riparia]
MQLNDSLDDDFLLGRSPLTYNISFNIVVIETKFISLASSFYPSDFHLRTSTQIIHLLQPFALIFFPSIRTSTRIIHLLQPFALILFPSIRTRLYFAMEYVELLKDMWSSISNYFNYHKILNENLTTLREKRRRLECREEDINTVLENAQNNRRKKAKREVENWLMEVQVVKDDAQQIEQEAGERRYFSRFSFLSQFEANMKKVDEMFESGNFPNGILIDVHQDEGNALLTAQLIGETTYKRNLENIWTCLEKGEIQSIGVWGMGGIGKTTVVTHIHDLLLENRDTFGHVYWVTVSKDSSIRRLQDAIAGKINLDFSKEEDEKIRAALLSEALQKKKKFVLLLDDVWEVYVPRAVGIPIGVDGGKLIITSRSRDVCLRMGCKEIIKMEPLSEVEAWELFNKTLERYNALSQNEEEIAKDIIKECGGLPLAIVTTARSMSVEYSIAGWRNALNELREHVEGHTIDMENDVFKILEFSYNRLNNEKLQECLLYCALFPEDYKIRRVSLIGYWIAEVLVEEMGSWQAERDRGHAILDKLENVCLLERCDNGKYVKMHDVIRDMAINISKKNSRFMVQIGRNLEDLPSDIEWSNNNVERASLMGSGVLSTLMFVPNWPKLSTLFLQNNMLSYSSRHTLDRGLPNSSFVHMLGLRVLNLSDTNIAFLPNSIYDKVKLRALILCNCPKLKRVGSLAKLKELRELNISDSQMETIPDGIEKLVHLKHFNWSSDSFYSNPLSNPLSNLFSYLVQLQCLRLDDSRLPDVGVEELSGLRKLEILEVKFSSLHNFNSYMMTEHYGRLTHYHVGLNGFGYFLSGETGICKAVTVEQFNLEGGKDNDDYHLVLPTNVQFFQIKQCHLPTGLLDVSQSLKMATDLKACLISRCKGIEYLWWVEDCIASLNTLWLDKLPSLRVLFKLRPIDIVRCSSLKSLYVSYCHNLKHLFTPELVKYHLKNLQSIHVGNCRQMEDLIVAAEVEEEEEEEEEEEVINQRHNLILCFPNLQSLMLEDLPKLKSIWKGTMTCDSLQQLTVFNCPKLRRLPLSVQINDGSGERRASTPPLKQIRGQKEWWDGLEWNTPHAKSIFEPLTTFESDTDYYSIISDFMIDVQDIFEDVCFLNRNFDAETM